MTRPDYKTLMRHYATYHFRDQLFHRFGESTTTCSRCLLVLCDQDSLFRHYCSKHEGLEGLIPEKVKLTKMIGVSRVMSWWHNYILKRFLLYGKCNNWLGFSFKKSFFNFILNLILFMLCLFNRNFCELDPRVSKALQERRWRPQSSKLISLVTSFICYFCNIWHLTLFV